jgi:IS4 transposase
VHRQTLDRFVERYDAESRVRHFGCRQQLTCMALAQLTWREWLSVAMSYRLRWRIELFFRWIKGPLRIKHYYGTSPNAVKTQVWIAMAVYFMVATIHKELSLLGTLHRTLQLLSAHPFEKTPIHELLTETNIKSLEPLASNTLLLWDL